MSNYDAIVAELQEQLEKERAAYQAFKDRADAQAQVLVKTQNAIDVIRERMAAKSGRPSTAQKVLGVAAQVLKAGAVAAIEYERTHPYRRMTILEAAKTFLAEHGPATAPEVTRALEAGGIQSQANVNTVRSILDRARIKGDGIEKIGTSWRVSQIELKAIKAVERQLSASTSTSVPAPQDEQQQNAVSS